MYELKHAITTTKMKVAKVKAERKTIDTLDINATAVLPGRCRLSDTLSVLFEPCHVRRIYSQFL